MKTLLCLLILTLPAAEVAKDPEYIWCSWRSSKTQAEADQAHKEFMASIRGSFTREGQVLTEFGERCLNHLNESAAVLNKFCSTNPPDHKGYGVAIQASDEAFRNCIYDPRVSTQKAE